MRNWKMPRVWLATKAAAKMRTLVESGQCRSLAKTFWRDHTLQLLTFERASTCVSITAVNDGRPPETANCKTCHALKCTNLAPSISMPIAIVKEKKWQMRDFFSNLAGAAGIGESRPF